MELDTDILRLTYLKSVHPATIVNPVPTILGREEKLQGFKLDRTASFPPPCGRPLTPTYKVRCSNPRLQMCPNPTYTDYTESESSVPINQMKTPSCESDNYHITYNAYEDTDSPEELIIDLDQDDNYLDDDDSDFEIEPQASSVDQHRTHRHVGEIAMGDYRTTSQSVVIDLETEDVSDDNLRDPMTKVTMKLRVVVSPDQENALNCQSKCNSSIPLSNESEHSTSNDSGFNTSMTDDPNAQYTHGQHHQKDTSAIPLTPSQLLEMGSNPIHTNNVPPTNASPHVYPYTSPTGTDTPVRPVIKFRFGNYELNHTESPDKEKCNSHLFTQCPASVEGMSCHSLVKKNADLSKQMAFNPQGPADSTTKRYKCYCCERTNLSSKAIAAHRARKYKCYKCEERFCLQEILYKHSKICVYRSGSMIY